MKTKTINLALQGGGSHGAFTWGVLEQMLLDERIHIEGISATSAGAMNAAVMAYGLTTGGREKAIQLLHDFWQKVSEASAFGAVQHHPWQQFWGVSPQQSYMFMDNITQMFAPQQMNPMDINPLRNVLDELVDFEQIAHCRKLKLFINATNVRTGKIRVFECADLTRDALLASACLPNVFHTVYVDGEPYWDGGYSGNPALFPLIYHTECNDILLVQINPLEVDEVPSTAAGILDRLNEISFNATLIREMRAIAFVQKLKEGEMLRGGSEEQYRKMRIHMIEAGEITRSLGRLSKMDASWGFLRRLHEAGMASAKIWIDTHYDAIGEKSSVDIRKVFL